MSFFLWKAKVASLKILAVPKVGSPASQLADRWSSETNHTATQVIGQPILRTDSTGFLKWLHCTPKQPNFFANRLCEILECTTGEPYIHVSTSGTQLKLEREASQRMHSSEAIGREVMKPGVEKSDVTSWNQQHFFVSLNDRTLNEVEFGRDCSLRRKAHLHKHWSPQSKFEQSLHQCRTSFSLTIKQTFLNLRLQI